MPAAGRGEEARALSSASSIDFEGMMFVISSSESDENFARTASFGRALAVGLTASTVTRLSLVTTSWSPDSSPRPGRFVKGSMILRSLDPSPLANRKPAPDHSTEKDTVEEPKEK